MATFIFCNKKRLGNLCGKEKGHEGDRCGMWTTPAGHPATREIADALVRDRSLGVRMKTGHEYNPAFVILVDADNDTATLDHDGLVVTLRASQIEAVWHTRRVL